MKYEFLSFVPEGKSISGPEMLQKAEKLKCNTSKEDAEYLLSHQEEIPKEEREYYIIFPKYFKKDSRGILLVACLSWSGGRWCLFFFRLVYDWGDGARLARSKSLDTSSLSVPLDTVSLDNL